MAFSHADRAQFIIAQLTVGRRGAALVRLGAGRAFRREKVVMHGPGALAVFTLMKSTRPTLTLSGHPQPKHAFKPWFITAPTLAFVCVCASSIELRPRQAVCRGDHYSSFEYTNKNLEPRSFLKCSSVGRGARVLWLSETSKGRLLLARISIKRFLKLDERRKRWGKSARGRRNSAEKLFPVINLVARHWRLFFWL